MWSFKGKHMLLRTERGLLKSIDPMFGSRKRKRPEQVWNVNHYIFADVLSDLTINRIFKSLKKEIPKNPNEIFNNNWFSTFLTKEEDILKSYWTNYTMNGIDKDMFKFSSQALSILIKESELKKQYLFLKKLTPKKLLEVITECSEYKINRFEFRCNVLGKFQNRIINLPEPDNLFRFNVVDEVSDKRGVIDRTYNFIFNTFVGFFFVRNLIMINFDWIDTELYSLSDYTQLLYRTSILPYYDTVVIGKKKIVEKLNLYKKDGTWKKKVVGWLNELKDTKFIQGFEERNKIWVVGFSKKNRKKNTNLNQVNTNLNQV
jgi:hypothetical protein